MKKIATTIAILGLALSAMAQSASAEMQHRAGVSVGLGMGSLRQQMDNRAEGVNAKWGTQDMLELDYIFLSQPLGEKQLFRLGARAGLGFDLMSNRLTADRTSGNYQITDYEGRTVEYTTEVTGISEKNTAFSVAVPIQLVFRMENGLFAAAGVRLLCPVAGSYRQTTTANDIVAYYPLLEVHEPNQAVTGQMTQGYSAEGSLRLAKPMCNIDLEAGYEWTLPGKHFLRLTAYGSIPTMNAYTAQGGYMLNVSDPRASGATVVAESLMNAHGTRMQQLSFGLRFGYCFNFGK